MEKKEILDKIKHRFNLVILHWDDKSDKRIYIDIDKKDLINLVKFLFTDLTARFVIASGVDTPKAIEILYHFSFDRYGLIISLRVILPKPTPEIESITPIIKGAEWIEMEIRELLGVKFRNHPNSGRLLMSEDWPEGKFPLRRDYKEKD